MARSSDAVFPLSLLRDKSFQLGQIRRVVWLTLFFIVQSTLVLGVFYYFLLGDIVDGTAPLLFTSEDMALLNEQIPSVTSMMMKWLAVMLVINAIITSAIAVYAIRKMGNPILAMHRALNEMGDGNLNVRLREGDSKEFNDLYLALNRATSNIQDQVESARSELGVLDKLEEQPAPKNAEAEDEGPDEVLEALQNCRNVLNFFNEQQVPFIEKKSADS